MELNTGHLLAGGRYRIERVLGQGGFGITYLAEQTGLARNVAIKEFFMKELCNREGDTSHVTVPSMGGRDMVDRFREKFIKEARAIARLSHKHIVRIIDVFEENNTAYYVMEYVGGGSLGEKSKGCALPEEAAVRYIRQVASALDYVHSQRMMHLNVKPGNVLLNSDDEAVLIDFGLSKQYDMSGEQTSSTPVGISHGYAPLEQYKRGGVGTFSPATDIYSLGATLYSLLTGETPPEAGDVNDEGLPALPGNVSAPVRKAVEAAMQPRRKDRPQSIGEFIALLDGSSAGVISNVSEKSQTLYDDGETVVSFDNNSSSTLGGEVSRSDGGEKSQSARPVIPTKRSAEEFQSAKEEILRSAQDDKNAKKENPARPVISNDSEKSPNKPAKEEILHSVQDDKGAKKDKPADRVISNVSEKSQNTPFNKKWLVIAAIAFVVVVFGVNWYGDYRAADAACDRFVTRSFTVNGVSFKMVAVDGGTFKMGAISEQQNPDDDEKPVHNVTLSSYYIGETEVTQALWEAVMGSNPSGISGSNNPVEQISYDDCIAFINRLNSLLSDRLSGGMKFRLPTEAEWEFAARGGIRSRGYQYSGGDNFDIVAWYDDNSGRETHPVKQKQPNELGLYDMSGNVWEWCHDWYGDYPSSSQSNPTGPSSGSHRVLRGGGWNYNAQDCRVANRYYYTPYNRHPIVGLRLVLAEEDTAHKTQEEVARNFTVKGVSFKMVAVDGGNFNMGATSAQQDSYDDETSVCNVTLSSYYIGETEVTQALWEAVMGSNPSKFLGSNNPVDQVSYDDCITFISRLNSLLSGWLPSGMKFRLPTEAEWEYAARGGNRSLGYKYSGSDNLDSVAWYLRNSHNNLFETHPVKQKQPNELGLYDMSGNVKEWCHDWYGDYPSSSQTNPKGPSSGSDRVLRGGSCVDVKGCAVVAFSTLFPYNRHPYIGLRLALAQEESAQTRGTINGHDYVDLGLSVKWATCNVGASTPGDYGDYYAWGETSTKSSYVIDNSATHGKQMSSIAGNPTYDVARKKWGSPWRLPTKAEFDELIDNCTWTWTTQNGHNGYKVTSKKNGNSIFLPAAGWRYGASSYGQGARGYYWSATPGESYSVNAFDLNFHEGSRFTNWLSRYEGDSVRPVCD